MSDQFDLIGIVSIRTKKMGTASLRMDSIVEVCSVCYKVTLNHPLQSFMDN